MSLHVKRMQHQEECRRPVHAQGARGTHRPSLTCFHLSNACKTRYDDLEQNLVGPDRIPPGVDHLNRYINILPNPRTRVRLEEVEGAGDESTYINANYIAGHDGAFREYESPPLFCHARVDTRE